MLPTSSTAQSLERSLVGMEDAAGQVWVQTVEVNAHREIGWGSNLAQKLQERTGDIRTAIVAGSAAVAGSLDSVEPRQGWALKEVSASFGVTLAAEAGVILSRASAEATFIVTVTFDRFKSESTPS
jgi:Trypsin-co-occurring domain 1